MRPTRRWATIISALFLAVALAACSTSRLAYNQVPTLAYYWLDGYFDLDGPQSLATKDSLQSLQAWHRQQELPLLADTLKNLQSAVTQDVSAEQVCSLRGNLQQRLQSTLVQFTPALVRLTGTLTTAQLQQLEAKFKERNAKWQGEWLELTPAERLEQRSGELVERTERFYGKLDAAQRAIIRDQLAAAGYDPQMLYREALRRQQDIVQTLTQLRKAPLDPAAAQVQLQNLFARAQVSPDPQARRYSETMAQALCVGLAAVHQRATSAQRARLQAALKDYEGDARALMAQSQTGQTTP